MTLLGWIVMIVSVGCVLALNAFCLYRVLTLPPAGEAVLTTPEGLGEGEFPVVDSLNIGRRYREVLYVGRSAIALPACLAGIS